MSRSSYSKSESFDRAPRRRRSSARKTKRPQCLICKEPFDTLLFAVTLKKGKAHPVCAALKAIGLEQLAKTSGR